MYIKVCKMYHKIIFAAQQFYGGKVYKVYQVNHFHIIFMFLYFFMQKNNSLIFKQEPKKTGPNFKITKGVSTNIQFDFLNLELE